MSLLKFEMPSDTNTQLAQALLRSHGIASNVNQDYELEVVAADPNAVIDMLRQFNAVNCTPDEDAFDDDDQHDL